MTETPPKHGAGAASPQSSRDSRRAEALRANLVRRKIRPPSPDAGEKEAANEKPAGDA
jgi:hypothetical protein